MKKTLFFVLGTTIILLLIAVWVYLLFFGTAREITPNDTFADLGPAGSINPNASSTIDIEPTTNNASVIDLAQKGLRQLSIKPVAGYIEVTQSSTTLLYYAEKGTGHIFSIDLTTGTEVRLSATTIAQTSDVQFSDDGSIVAVTTPTNTKAKLLTIARLNASSTSLTTLYSDTVYDTSIDSSNNVLFTTGDGRTLTAHRFNPVTNKKTTLFTLPFFEATIAWGEHSTSSHLVYPKTTRELEGFLYEVTPSGNLTRLPFQGYGLSAFGNSDMIMYNIFIGRDLVTNIYNRTTKTTKKLDAPVLPEKCALQPTGFYFACGYSVPANNAFFPDNWYRGEISLSDTLYGLNGDMIQSVRYSDPEDEVSRAIDAIKVDVSSVRLGIYFINKNDDTLWMYAL